MGPEQEEGHLLSGVDSFTQLADWSCDLVDMICMLTRIDLT